MVVAQFCARVRTRADLPLVSMKGIYQHPSIGSVTTALRPDDPVPTLVGVTLRRNPRGHNPCRSDKIALGWNRYAGQLRSRGKSTRPDRNSSRRCPPPALRQAARPLRVRTAESRFHQMRELLNDHDHPALTDHTDCAATVPICWSGNSRSGSGSTRTASAAMDGTSPRWVGTVVGTERERVTWGFSGFSGLLQCPASAVRHYWQGSDRAIDRPNAPQFRFFGSQRGGQLMTRYTRPFCDDSRCRLNRAVDSRPASKRNLLLSGRPGRATSPSWDLGIRTPLPVRRVLRYLGGG